MPNTETEHNEGFVWKRRFGKRWHCPSAVCPSSVACRFLCVCKRWRSPLLFSDR